MLDLVLGDQGVSSKLNTIMNVIPPTIRGNTIVRSVNVDKVTQHVMVSPKVREKPNCIMYCFSTCLG